MTFDYRISKLLSKEFWLADAVIVRDRSPPLGQTSKNLMNHPCPEKSQSTCPSFRRSEQDAAIAKIKVHITKSLCPVRHVACTEAITQRCSVRKKVLLEILQTSQENTCSWVSFLIKLQAYNFFTEHLRWLFLLVLIRSSRPEVFLGKDVLKICS